MRTRSQNRDSIWPWIVLIGSLLGAALFVAWTISRTAEVRDALTAITRPTSTTITAATTTAPTTVSATATTTAPTTTTTTAPDPTLVWERIALDPETFPLGARLWNVAAFAGGVAAVGERSETDRAVAWLSGDGLEWDAWTIDPDETSIARSVSAWNGGLVVVGSVGTASEGDLRGAVWVSDDGSEWQRVEHDESIFGGGLAALNEVEFTPLGLVAIGQTYRRSVSSQQQVQISALQWIIVTSDDGITWRRPFDGEGQAGRLTAWNEHLYVAGTTDRSITDVTGQPLGLRVPVVWRSDDGMNWERTDLPAGSLGAHPFEIITVTDGLLALGTQLRSTVSRGDATNDSDAVLWTTADGQQWRAVSPPDESILGGLSDQSAHAAIEWAGGIVVMGTDRRCGVGFNCSVVVWTKGPGTPWGRIPFDPEVFGNPSRDTIFSVVGLVALGDSVLAVGHTSRATKTEIDQGTRYANEEDKPIVWIGTPTA